MSRRLAGLLALPILSLAPALGQRLPDRWRPWAANVVVPQARSISFRPAAAVQIAGVAVRVAILEQVAATTLEIDLRNPGPARQEAELLVPVPDGAVVKGFTFQGAGAEPGAELLPRDEARRIYEGLVASIRDPALLEFAGFNTIRSSVFPVEPHGAQKVRLVYEHLLPAEGDRVDYLLPRSESVAYAIPWRIAVDIQAKRRISTAYSPSHRIVLDRPDENRLTARVTDDAVAEPGPFRLSFLLEQNGLTATLLAYPDPKLGGGYFLLLAGLPAGAAAGAAATPIRREVILVLDRSGSMAGEKLDQALAAARQVLAGLEDGESFNLIAYNESVDRFAATPMPKRKDTYQAACTWLSGIRAAGGTNLHDALVEALRAETSPGVLPLVLFLTDGLPTIGQTSEAVIRDAALKANHARRRVFTFGVGADVNTPLLEKIAAETRAVATFVLPREDVEIKVAGVFKKLSGPVLTDTQMRVLAPDGAAALGRVREVLPAKLPDLFAGDQLVVLGQYVGGEPLGLELGGNYLGGQRRFRFSFELSGATTRNGFVPRLWASRKIAVLIDAIRQTGAEAPWLLAAGGAPPDARLRELVEEIVRLSAEFGVLTEYTAFLAREGVDLARLADIRQTAFENLNTRAVHARSGLAALNQDLNRQSLANLSTANSRNLFLDEDLARVEISTVQQVADRAFFRRQNRWVDSRLIGLAEAGNDPPRVIDFGSQEFKDLLERLAREGRQGIIALEGEILLLLDGKPVLVKGPGAR